MGWQHDNEVMTVVTTQIERTQLMNLLHELTSGAYALVS